MAENTWTYINMLQLSVNYEEKRADYMAKLAFNI